MLESIELESDLQTTLLKQHQEKTKNRILEIYNII